MGSTKTKKPKDDETPKPDKKIDPLSFADVPGLGAVSIKALAKAGIVNTLQMVTKTPTVLKDVTGMDRDKAGQAFAFMKKNLQEAGLLSASEMTALELYNQRLTIKRLRTQCKAFDEMLGGGLECGSITEFFGVEGAGKTQTSHTCCIEVQRPLIDGGLAEEGKMPPMIIYIDTENTFRPERILSILEGRGYISPLPADLQKKLDENRELAADEKALLDESRKKQLAEATPWLERIIVQKATDAQQQVQLIHNVGTMLASKTPEGDPIINIRLIVVDSGTALFRREYLGRGNIKSKFELMNEMIHDLKSIAWVHQLPVIFVNQIYNAPEEQFGLEKDKAYGGHIIGHTVPYRVFFFKRSEKTHGAQMFKSPMHSKDDIKFILTAKGIEDVEK